MKTVTGEPLKVIGSELADADAPVVLNADVLSWFQRRGFTEKESDGGATVIFRLLTNWVPRSIADPPQVVPLAKLAL